MIGRRLPVVDGKTTTPTEPGDYCGPVEGYTGNRPMVAFKLPVPDDHPDAGLRHVCEPPHSFQEEADGTLTIEGSILAVRPTWKPAAREAGEDDPPPWHGYLTRGVWLEV